MIKFYCDRCGDYIPDDQAKFKIHIYSESDIARFNDDKFRKRHYCERCIQTIISTTEKYVNDWLK